MNLYLFHDTGSSANYGIGSYIKELTHALIGSATHFRIIHLRSPRDEFEIEKTNHFENWYIPDIPNSNYSNDAIKEMEAYHSNVIFLLKIHIKETKNLIFHFNYNHCRLLAKELKTAFSCKIIETIHYTKWQIDFHGNMSKFRMLKAKSEEQRDTSEQRMFALYEYESMMFKEVDRIIALSQYMQYVLETEYQLDSDIISVIPNGIGDTDYSSLTKADFQFSSHFSGSKVNTGAGLRKKWRISANEFLILFVGRLHPVKGLGYLLRAFRNVLEKIPDCRLMIAGSGNFDIYMTEAKDICTKITFTGLLEKQALYELYQMANIGVMPSFHEQCSYVAIEMMMHGVPLIASTSTGLKEMVEDGVTGLHIPVIEYNDSAEIDTDLLAEKMLFLLQNPDERQRMGANARKRYMEKYSSTAFGANMIAFYESLFRDNKHKSSL